MDIAIAGSGTAGLAVAALLARDSHKVTLFERFDEAQPVGSGLMLQPTGMAVLGALNRRDEALARGARIERLHGVADGRIVLDVRYASLRRPDGFGLAIHRADLFDLLHGAALAAGAAFRTGRSVTAAAAGSLHFEDGSREGPFDLVIDATGSRSPLAGEAATPLAYGALWTTVEGIDGLVPSDTLSQRYHRACQMAGLLPLGRGANGANRTALFWSLRADRYDATMAAGTTAWRAAWTELWPETAAFAEAVPAIETMTFARYAHRTRRAPVADRLVHIGDSWHSTSPQLGQGANQALLDAYALAVALRGNGPLQDRLDRAIASRRRHVGLYQAMSHWLTPVYQSDGRLVPLLRDWLVGPLSSIWPVPQVQARMVSGLVGRPLERLGLGGPCTTGTDV